MDGPRLGGPPPTPRHFWVIGVLALLWYVSGAVTIQLAELGQLPGIKPDEALYYATKPRWLSLATGVATYGSVLGSILLLARRKAAVTVFVIALAVIILTNCLELIDGTSLTLANNGAAIATAVIVVIAIFMPLYARAMAGRRVLR